MLSTWMHEYPLQAPMGATISLAGSILGQPACMQRASSAPGHGRLEGPLFVDPPPSLLPRHISLVPTALTQQKRRKPPLLLQILCLQNLITPKKRAKDTETRPLPTITRSLSPSGPLPPASSVAVITLNLCLEEMDFSPCPSSQAEAATSTPWYSCLPTGRRVYLRLPPVLLPLQMRQRGAVITQKRQIKGEATTGRWPSDRMFRAEHPAGQFKAR